MYHDCNHKEDESAVLPSGSVTLAIISIIFPLALQRTISHNREYISQAPNYWEASLVSSVIYYSLPLAVNHLFFHYIKIELICRP